MKARAALALIAVALAITPAARAGGSGRLEIVDAPDTPLSSPNVHLVTTVHTGSAVGGKFATIDGKPYYFQTSTRPGFFIPSGVGDGGVNAFDVSDPERPLLVGHLPLPLSQNEDVELSAKRGVLLYSVDSRRVANQACSEAETEQQRAILCQRMGGFLVVVDISMPSALRVLSVLALPETVGFRADGMPNGGPGHTASCILDCAYAYVSGSRDQGVHVVDLRDPANPAIIGVVKSPAGADGNGYVPGVVHDVTTDSFGNMWIVGSGGSAMYAPVKDPLKPTLLATIAGADNKKYNHLIHHGAVRLNRDTILIGEENFASDDCGADADGFRDGSLQTWKIDGKRKRLSPQGSWNAELATASQSTLAATAGIACSSHWFDVNAHRVVADAFYEQGVRFLDVTNPAKIRQVGFWIAPATAAGQAQFVPGRPDLVYVSDYSRGLDVIRIDAGGKGAPTVVAPARAEWFAGGVTFGPRLEPDDTFGYACRRPA